MPSAHLRWPLTIVREDVGGVAVFVASGRLGTLTSGDLIEALATAIQDGARRLPNVLANARPEVLILLEGINDIGSQLDLGVTRALNAVNSMAQEARNRRIRVILATLPPSRYIGVDGLHPTEAGYERMAELIFLRITQEFEVK